MGVYRRGEVWWIDYYATKPATGERVRFREPVCGNKRKAQEALDSIKVKIRTGELNPFAVPTATEGTSFARAVELYIEDRIAAGMQESSYNYLADWREAFDGRLVAEITTEEIEEQLRVWVAGRELSPATRNRMLAQLSGMFSYAYGPRRWIDSHPTERGRVPKLAEDNARERWLEPHEIELLVKHAPAWMVPIIRFAVHTGMRLGEVCSLTRASYHEDEKGSAWVETGTTKNRTVHLYPLRGWARQYVEERIEALPFPGSYLFTGPGRRLKEGGRAPGNARPAIRRSFREVVEAAGLPYGRGKDQVSFHTFRHSMATLSRRAGVTEAEIQEMGNWKDARMVRRYAKVPKDLIQSGAEKLATFLGGHTVVTAKKATPKQTAAAAS